MFQLKTMYLDYYSLLASNSQKEVGFLELYIDINFYILMQYNIFL